jgi:hypothetical protein
MEHYDGGAVVMPAVPPMPEAAPQQAAQQAATGAPPGAPPGPLPRSEPCHRPTPPPRGRPSSTARRHDQTLHFQLATMTAYAAGPERRAPFEPGAPVEGGATAALQQEIYRARLLNGSQRVEEWTARHTVPDARANRTLHSARPPPVRRPRPLGGRSIRARVPQGSSAAEPHDTEGMTVRERWKAREARLRAQQEREAAQAGELATARGQGRAMRKAALEQVRTKLKGLSYGAGCGARGQDPAALFAHFDRDNDGHLDFEEFKNAVRKGGSIAQAQISDRELRRLFRRIDADGSGAIEIEELASFVWGERGQDIAMLAAQRRNAAQRLPGRAAEVSAGLAGWRAANVGPLPSHVPRIDRWRPPRRGTTHPAAAITTTMTASTPRALPINVAPAAPLHMRPLPPHQQRQRMAAGLGLSPRGPAAVALVGGDAAERAQYSAITGERLQFGRAHEIFSKNAAVYAACVERGSFGFWFVKDTGGDPYVKAYGFDDGSLDVNRLRSQRV